MNKHILELAKQCGYWSGQTIEMNDIGVQKFAELIVKECMTLCKTSVGNADYNTGRLHCLENIKSHFGVKE